LPEQLAAATAIPAPVGIVPVVHINHSPCLERPEGFLENLVLQIKPSGRYVTAVIM